MPGLSGREANAALSTLSTTGFPVDATTVTPTGALLVTTQEPAWETMAATGSTVRISVGATGSDASPRG